MSRDNDPAMTTLWLFTFVHEEEICEFRTLCPWLEQIGKHYVAELDMLSEAMVDFLTQRGIPYTMLRYSHEVE